VVGSGGRYIEAYCKILGSTIGTLGEVAWIAVVYRVKDKNLKRIPYPTDVASTLPTHFSAPTRQSTQTEDISLSQFSHQNSMFLLFRRF
jgi:hypothetical protein